MLSGTPVATNDTFSVYENQTTSQNSPTVTELYFDGNSYIYSGTHTWSTSDGSFIAAGSTHNGGVSFESTDWPNSGDDWSLEFASPVGEALIPGTYTGAERYPYENITAPGLDVSGDGRSNNTVTGQFTINEAILGANIPFTNLTTYTNFAADFEQHSDGAASALFGHVWYNHHLVTSVLANDSGGAGALSAVLVSGPQHGTLSMTPDGNFSYTPNTNYTGTDSFTYEATDGTTLSNVATVTLNVLLVNQPPSFTKGADQTINENSGSQTIANWATNISPGPAIESTQTVSFNVSNNNTSLFSVQPAIDSSGNLTYTPATGFYGTATITVAAHDNGGTVLGGVDTSAAQTFVITVNHVNQPPTFTMGSQFYAVYGQGATTIPNWATNISTGPNESSQTVAFNTTTDNPSLFIIPPTISPTGTLSFTPNSNQSGTATVTVYLQDNGGTANGGNDTSATQIFKIYINPPNTPPSFTKGADQTVKSYCQILCSEIVSGGVLEDSIFEGFSCE
jgi:VCBS repeat-containing protein